MNYKVATTTEFEKEAKYLAKKYISFKADLKVLIEALNANPLWAFHWATIPIKSVWPFQVKEKVKVVAQE